VQAGSSVSILGNNLANPVQVMIGNTAVNFTGQSATSLIAAVPANARSGPITVSTAAGFGTSAAILTITGPPQISDFFPAEGGIGQSVAVDGTNLDTTTSIEVGGVLTTRISIDDSSLIWFEVPAGALSGPIRITSALGVATSTDIFTVRSVP
jgi:hypothetical protein